MFQLLLCFLDYGYEIVERQTYSCRKHTPEHKSGGIPIGVEHGSAQVAEIAFHTRFKQFDASHQILLMVHEQFADAIQINGSGSHVQSFSAKYVLEKEMVSRGA